MPNIILVWFIVIVLLDSLLIVWFFIGIGTAQENFGGTFWLCRSSLPCTRSCSL